MPAPRSPPAPSPGRQTPEGFRRCALAGRGEKWRGRWAKQAGGEQGEGQEGKRWASAASHLELRLVERRAVGRVQAEVLHNGRGEQVQATLDVSLCLPRHVLPAEVADDP